VAAPVGEAVAQQAPEEEEEEEEERSCQEALVARATVPVAGEGRAVLSAAARVREVAGSEAEAQAAEGHSEAR